MRIMAVANQKGGVGKTTTAINLATGLAAVGQKILLVDLDPQGNASTGLGIPAGKRRLTSYDILEQRCDIQDAMQETMVKGLYVLPATVDLSGVEIELATGKKRSFRLAQALDKSRLTEKFDLVLIDCPPSLGLLTVNALTAADSVLVPLQCEFFALEGLTLLLRTIEEIRVRQNSALSLFGIVMTMYDGRNRLSCQVVEDVRASLGDMVFDTIIPRNVRLSEAPSHGLPAVLYDHRAPGPVAYCDLAREVIARFKHPKHLKQNEKKDPASTKSAPTEAPQACVEEETP